MSRKGMQRRWLVLIAGVAVAGAPVGAVVGAQLRSAPGPEIEASLRDAPLVRVAEIPGDRGLAGRGVFAQVTSTGFLCLWDAPAATARTRQGGCNAADDPFDGGALYISFAYEGGPAPADVQDARLIGLAAPEVASVQVLMSDGTRRDVRLRAAAVGAADYRAFGYRVGQRDLRTGIAPSAVLALDQAGMEIDRRATGFVD